MIVRSCWWHWIIELEWINTYVTPSTDHIPQKIRSIYKIRDYKNPTQTSRVPKRTRDKRRGRRSPPRTRFRRRLRTVTHTFPHPGASTNTIATTPSKSHDTETIPFPMTIHITFYGPYSIFSRQFGLPKPCVLVVYVLVARKYRDFKKKKKNSNCASVVLCNATQAGSQLPRRRLYGQLEGPQWRRIPSINSYQPKLGQITELFAGDGTRIDQASSPRTSPTKVN